jgi:hypothetical protein
MSTSKRYKIIRYTNSEGEVVDVDWGYDTRPECMSEFIRLSGEGCIDIVAIDTTLPIEE